MMACFQGLKSLFILGLINVFLFNTVAAKTLETPYLISTKEYVDYVDASEAKRNFEKIISSEVVKSHLSDLGLSLGEIESRLASLSDKEIQELHMNAQQAQAGGLLVEVLLVILIIYFAQRI